MTAEQIFSIANIVSVLCWILLAVLPNRRWVTDVVTGKAAPALFAVAYIAIVIAVFPRAEGSFSTLAGVMAALREPVAATRRLAALSRVRPVDRHVGSTRQYRARRTALAARPLPVPDADVRPDGMAHLHGS